MEQWLRRVDSAVLSDALKLVDSKDGEKKPITKLEEVLEEEILETRFAPGKWNKWIFSMKNTMWSKFCEKKIFILYFVIQMYLWYVDNFRQEWLVLGRVTVSSTSVSPSTVPSWPVISIPTTWPWG